MELANFLILISSIVTYTSIYIILSLSTNLEYGYTGIPNFGKVFFFFIGGIVSSVITISMYDTALGIQDHFSSISAMKRTQYSLENPLFAVEVFLISFIASILISGITGYLASYPALALREDFLAITLLVFGEAGRVFVRTYEPLIGGVFGVSGIPNPLNYLGNITNQATAQFIYSMIVLALSILIFLVMERLTNSPFGRVMKAVREDDLAASTLGKNIARIRGEVLIVSSAMAGMAGSLFVFYTQSIFPDDFIPAVTFLVISMVLVGGVSNNVGAVIGSVILSIFDRFTQASIIALFGFKVPFDISYLRYAMTGLLIVLIMLFRPQGILPEGVVKTSLYDLLDRRLKVNRKVDYDKIK